MALKIAQVQRDAAVPIDAYESSICLDAGLLCFRCFCGPVAASFHA